MLALNDDRWPQLHHAYGEASAIPQLLAVARTDEQSGAREGSPWFDLWSALCHQGDVYSASYAAVPHLISIASEREAPGQFEPLLLAGSIEQARLEGHGPPVPQDLLDDYTAAVHKGADLAKAALAQAWNDEARTAFSGSLAALTGDVVTARAIFDSDLD